MPALLLLLLWTVFDGAVIKALILDTLPEPFSDETQFTKTLIYSEVLRLTEGNFATTNADALRPVADYWLQLNAVSQRLMFSLAGLLVVGGFAMGWFRFAGQANIRARFERVVMLGLLACASLAVLTTVGIVFSVVFESLRFFESVSIVATQYFF